jgi:hypothetical protein
VVPHEPTLGSDFERAVRSYLGNTLAREHEEAARRLEGEVLA